MFRVVIAEKQTSGRGQRGNSWESEPGKNLTFSIVLYPHHIPASRQFALSQIISLGIIDILQKFGPGFSIKWPNDIYWNEKKLVGILIENELTGPYIQYGHRRHRYQCQPRTFFIHSPKSYLP